jgi:peroxiredoxin
VSPDAPDKVREIVPKVRSKLPAGASPELGITLLSDARHETIDRYGLLNEAAAAKGLPHPTTYIIDRTGAVRWKFTEKNYRVRPTNRMILEELGKIL